MFIWIVALAWLYVALMMALAEAMHPSGSVLGAIFTFLLYGLGPVSIVVYVMSAPLRKRQRLLREQAEARAAAGTDASASGLQPDAGGHAAGDAVAAEGKEV